MDAQLTLLTIAIGGAAILYASVGHGGASAYLALMALFGLAPEAIRPAALALNIVVAGYAAFSFLRADRFDWSVFWPLALTAIPSAYLAGQIDIDERFYRPLLAIALAAAALRYIAWPKLDANGQVRAPPLIASLPTGAALGGLAGLTGIGGGVYLSPLLVFARWADPQRAAGITACFIVVNSAAGLAGRLNSLTQTPAFLPQLALAALVGAAIGAGLSVARLDKTAILRALGIVLGVAALAIVWA